MATDVDLESTYLGVSRHCADDLLHAEDLETIEVTPDTGFYDRINSARDVERRT
ncbi:MAG: hypothetical protein ACRDSP_12780 [Pseudonocardiaceae bacterium]